MAWLTTALACGGSGKEPGDQRLEGYRSDAPFHKVQLSARQAAELEKQGARVLGDYGSFKLVQVDEATLASLPAAPDVELRDDYDHILLSAGVIDTASASAQSLRGMRKMVATSGKRFHLVHFSGPVRSEWLAELEATGVKVVTYVPNNAYLVYGDAAALGGLQRHITASPAIQWDGEYLDDYKLHPTVHTSATPTYGIQLIKDEEANATTLALIRKLQSREGVIQEALDYVNVVAWVDRQALNEIVQRPDVLSIQPRPRRKKFDERQNMILAGQLTGNGPTGPGYLAWLASKGFTQAQFTASGFGVDVTDSGLDNGTAAPNHFGLYLNGDVSSASRVVYARLEGSPSTGSSLQGCDGHGNLNAHIVAGFASQTGAPYTDTTGFTHGLGVAPFVKVGSSVIFDPDNFTYPDYEDLQSRAYRDGMRISSNSWGASTDLYDADAQRYDALVRDAQPMGSAVPNPGNQEMFIAFAAGNDGPTVGSIGSPGTAKNVISVGASENVRALGGDDGCGTTDGEANSLHDIVAFSSRGPAADGRKKPDIMAPGTHVMGGVAQAAGQRSTTPASPNGAAITCFDATGVCGGINSDFYYPAGQQWYTASSGTSHSTPAVAGAAALLRQYFLNQGRAAPSPAMTKALLMGSTRYMTGTGANDSLYSNNQGTGLMDLGMAFDGVSRLLDDQHPDNLLRATGETRTFTTRVDDPSRPFRVTLAWTDAPGATNASAWKNNLDLSVTVGGNTYKGNVFSGGTSVPGGSADTQNNVESVFLPAGTTGPFTVTVTATNINSDGVPNNGVVLDQDFALAVYNACSTPGATLSGVTAAPSGTGSIDVSWTPNGASSYNVYRATTPGGPYARLGSVAAPPFTDSGLSGGTSYYYVVRAVDCAESPDSNEASAVSTGVCTLPPGFAGLTSVNNAGASTCSNTLAWSAASPSCGGALSYSVYRSTTPGFTPSAANRIATGVTGTAFSDDLNLTQGTPYYYVVRATETSTATFEETNTVQLGAVPTGAVSTGIRYFDDFDANRPANASAYWIPTVITGSASTMKIFSGCHYQSATNAYRMASTGTTCGGTYSTNQQLVLVLGGNGTVSPDINGFSIPSNPVSPQMTFNVWYNLQARFDGVYLVYSTTGASGPWTEVSDSASTTRPYISAGGYDNLLNGTTTRIWTYQSINPNGSLKPVTVNLGALAGQKVWFGFRFSSDGSTAFEGFYVDDVHITADAAATCTTNTPPPGPAVAYSVTGLPASVSAGTPSTVTVTAMDAVGVVATGYSGSASFTSSDARAVLPPSVSFTAGVASGLPVTFGTVGAQSLTATDTASPGLTGSGGTTVTPGPAAELTFTVQPSTAVAGVSISPAVKVGLLDAYGNTVSTGSHGVTVAIGNNAGGGTLSGTSTVNMSSGVATFSGLSLDKVGAGYTLTASSTGLTGVTSSGFNITPASANKLAFVTQPSTVGAGAAITPAVQVAIVDRFGNMSTSTSNVTLALSASPAGTTLSGTTTVAAVNGVATFSNLLLDKVGTGNRLTATSGSFASLGSEPFQVLPGTPYRATITRQPSDVAAGAPISPAVEVSVYDRHGNLATQVNTPVSVSLGYNPSGGLLGGTTTVNAVSGVATFDALWVNRPGVNYTLVAGASGLFLDTSASFNVSVGAPARLAFTSAPPASTASGAAFTARVEVQDSAGNRVSSASPQVVLSLVNAAGATLGGPTTVTATGGVATFSGLSVDKAGTGYVLQADVTGLTPEHSPAFGVVPGAPVAVSFLTQPGDTTAGTAITPAVVVAVKDAHGNTVTSSNASVTLAFGNNPGGGVLSGSATAPVVGGVATFANLSIERAGAGYTLVASSGALASDTSAGFDVKVGPAARLGFRAAPANAVAGDALVPVTVELQDAQGNVDSGSTVDVALSLGGPAGGSLGGTTTVTAVNGVATFPSLFINRAATGYTLSASAPGLNGATSGTFDITPGAVAALAFTVQPVNVTAGTAFAPVVKVAIQDALGNVVASAQDEVTLSLASNPEGATLTGALKAAAVNGVASFQGLAVNRVGAGYTLVAASGTLKGATSSAFDVQPGASSRLVFKTGPVNTTAGSVLAPIAVEIRDAHGNPVAAADSITLTLQGGLGGSLGGTSTVAASNGVAAFGDLTITQAAAGYRLTAHAAGLVDVTSAAFEVSPGAAAALAFTVQPGVTQAGAAMGPAVQVAIRDAFGNVVTGASDAITLTLGYNPSRATLAGTTTVAAVNGVATFADLSLDRSARGYTLQASTGALPWVTSSAFDITAGAPARLVFRGMQDQLQAGATLAPIEVELQDALGNVLSGGTAQVTLSLGANPAAGMLLGAAPVSAVNGVARFEGVSLRKAGTGYTLVASAQSFAGATSTAFAVTPGPAASYALMLPASVTAGQEVTVSATAYDAHGNVATSYSGPVRVTSSDAAGVLPDTLAFSGGELTGLKVTFMSSGLRTLTLTDAERASLSGVAQTNVTPFAQPTVAVTEPAGGTEVSGEVRISAAGAVAAGTTPAQLSILVDGVVIATGNEATLTAAWDSSKVPGGSAHTLTAVFSDSAGNVVGSAPVGITVKPGSCGCGATSGADASLYLGLFALARYVSVRRRRTRKAA